MFITVKKKVWRYIPKYQKPCIEKHTFLTIQWPNKKGRNDNNELQIITQKTKKLATWTPQKTGLKFGASEGCAVPAPLLARVVLSVKGSIRVIFLWLLVYYILDELNGWHLQWVSDCCLPPTQLFHGENKLIFNEMIMRSALY